MRDAAADLNFEEAARLRDEIKRLTELELAISDDPLAKYAEAESPVSGREKGKHNKGRERHRAVDEGSTDASLFRKPHLDEMGADGAKPLGKSLFQKPDIDDMGPGTDMATPAGAVSRSLFKKQSAKEAHGSDYGVPGSSGPSPSGRQSAGDRSAPSRSGDSAGENKASLFRKNSLDEMTVRRTEKPVEGVKPARPDDAKPVRRERAGIGSYEEPADERRQRRRPAKTGRPGH
jgi:excinuclease ABC subunit B